MNELITFETKLPRGRFVVTRERPDFDFLKVKQTHSANILPEDHCMDLEADGIVGIGKTPKAILTADCIPIVILGAAGHAVVHAGWRGLSLKILAHENIKALRPNFAFLGPHIRPDHYEVQKDFLPNFSEYLEYKDAFTYVSGRIYFNLATVAITALAQLYPGIVIVDCGLCTFADLKFHSYRRDNTKERNWNIYIPESC